MSRRRVNANFTEQTYSTLEELSAKTGHSMSEVLRDSIAVYKWFIDARAQGLHVLVEGPRGSVRELIDIHG